MENKIFPCFWMDGSAKEAALFYCNVLKGTNFFNENQFVAVIQSSGQKIMF